MRGILGVTYLEAAGIVLIALGFFAILFWVLD
jgi:hypothetical protein